MVDPFLYLAFLTLVLGCHKKKNISPDPEVPPIPCPNHCHSSLLQWATVLTYSNHIIDFFFLAFPSRPGFLKIILEFYLYLWTLWVESYESILFQASFIQHYKPCLRCRVSLVPSLSWLYTAPLCEHITMYSFCSWQTCGFVWDSVSALFLTCVLAWLSSWGVLATLALFPGAAPDDKPSVLCWLLRGMRQQCLGQPGPVGLQCALVATCGNHWLSLWVGGVYSSWWWSLTDGW